jgi:hypothetical protein
MRYFIKTFETQGSQSKMFLARVSLQYSLTSPLSVPINSTNDKWNTKKWQLEDPSPSSISVPWALLMGAQYWSSHKQEMKSSPNQLSVSEQKPHWPWVIEAPEGYLESCDIIKLESKIRTNKVSCHNVLLKILVIPSIIQPCTNELSSLKLSFPTHKMLTMAVLTSKTSYED